jgi:7,8-dihydroneopterin aldolase/epimerase/oxygenase
LASGIQPSSQFRKFADEHDVRPANEPRPDYMKNNMGKISIEGIEFFAHHGCFAEERLIGGRFTVDVSFVAETGRAEVSDELSDTVNYQTVYALIKAEMDTPSKLLEHVAHRIADAILKQFPGISSLSVCVSKHNPPIGGKTDKVAFTINV